MSQTSKPCTVRLTRAAERDLKHVRPHLAAVLRAFNALESDATAGHPLSGTLDGLGSFSFNVRGSGAFRAVYAVVDDETVCVVVIVGPHENIYDRANRRVSSLRSSGEI